MRILKKMFATILAITLVVSVACGCSSKSASAKVGKYVEEEYTLPPKINYVSDLRQLDDGTIGVMGQDKDQNLSYYVSKDGGENWTEKEIKLPQVDAGSVAKTQSSVLDKQGDAFITYQIFTQENWAKIEESNKTNTQLTNEQADALTQLYKSAQTKMIKIDTKGNVSDVNLDETLKSEECSLSNIDDNGNLYFIYNVTSQTSGSQTIYGVDGVTGKIKSTIKLPDNEFANGFAVTNKYLICQLTTGAKKYSLDNGQAVGDLAGTKLENGGQSTYFKGSEDNQIYYVNQQGLYKYDLDKQKSTKIINGSSCSFGNTSMYLMKVIVKKDGSFLAAYGSQDKCTLCNYKYNSNASKPEHELTVYSLYNNQQLNDAVSTYQRKHKNISIKYEYGLDYDGAKTETDEIKNLNTKLKAGKGPDIIFLDGLNIKNYEKQGLLDDISDVINKKKSTLLGNVVDAYTKKDKKIYEFPLSIQIPVVTAKDASNISDLDSFTKAVQQAGKNNQSDILNVNEPKILLNTLYYSCAGSWLNKDNSLNKSKLKTFLEDAKSIYEVENKAHSQKEIDSYNEMMKSVKGSQYEKQFYEMYLTYPDISQSFFTASSMYNIYYLPSVQQLAMQEAFNKKTGNYNYNIWKGQNSNYFLPSTVVGLYSKSNEKDSAKKFISALLDGKLISNDFIMGFSVNKDLLKQSLDKSDFGSMGYGDQSSTGEPQNMLEIKGLSEDSKNQLLNYIKTLKTVPNMDKTVLDNASNEICDYISGKTPSVDDAINAISKKVEIQLAE